jgi:hypothetical protein
VSDPLSCYCNRQSVAAEKSPFLTSNLEGCLSPLLVMASGGDHGKNRCGGGPSQDGRQPLSC